MMQSDLLSGTLLTSLTDPLSVCAILCDLRPRFIAKGRVGAGYRAIARNGRILLASRQPLDELVGRAALIRFQTWHRTILPNEAPETYGVLMCASSRPELGRS